MVIIIACDHQPVSKMPKKHRKNEENRLFPPKTRIQTILDKNRWDIIFIFFCYFSVPSLTLHPSRNFLAVLPSPTLYKVETRKKFWIHASHIVCGVKGGVLDLCELEISAKKTHNINGSNFIHTFTQ